MHKLFVGLTLVGMLAISACKVEGFIPVELRKVGKASKQTIELELDMGFQDCDEYYVDFEAIVAQFDNIFPITCSASTYGGVIAFEMDVAMQHYDQRPNLSTALLGDEFVQIVTWNSGDLDIGIGIVGDFPKLNAVASNRNIMASLSADSLSDLLLRFDNRRGTSDRLVWIPFSKAGGTLSDAGRGATLLGGQRIDVTLPSVAWELLLEDGAVILGTIDQR